MITKYQLGLALPVAQATRRLDHWYPSLVDAMVRYKITSENRFTYFLANVAAETGQLQARQEDLNYSAERLIAVFPAMFAKDPQRARELAHQGPEAIANHIYSDAHRPLGYRMGNVQAGDGWKFRGRGPMQITGKDNYRQFFHSVGLPDDSDPDLLLQPRYGALAAAEYWARRGCNGLADAGNFTECVVRVNGGTTDLASRTAYLKRLQDALAHPGPVQSAIPHPLIDIEQQLPDDLASLKASDQLEAGSGSVLLADTLPPQGYTITESGNVVRSNMTDSVILRSARVGQRIAWGTGIISGILTGLQALREAFVGVFSGVSPALLVGLSGVAALLAVAAFLYFRGIERRRIEMHEKGIA